MTIRKARYNDLAAIRQLPLQFTGRPVAGILHKQFRVIVLDARVQALVLEDEQLMTGFIVLRLYSSRGLNGRLMAIVHLAVSQPAAVQRLLAAAEQFAAEQLCDSLVVSAVQLTAGAVSLYQTMGYEPLAGTLTKTLPAALEAVS